MSANNLKKQFQRLENMEAAIFQQVQRYQTQMIKDLAQRQDLKKRQQTRKLQIRLKAPKQLITNPNNNHVWVQLANFLDEQQFIDLDGIQQRKRQREEIRSQLQKKRLLAQSIDDVRSQVGSQRVEQSEKRTQKIPWKLMRELRRKEVEENKARLERIQENKRQKVDHYHKY